MKNNNKVLVAENHECGLVLTHELCCSLQDLVLYCWELFFALMNVTVYVAIESTWL